MKHVFAPGCALLLYKPDQRHAAEQPSLDEVAAHIGLSAWHFQRLFTRWAGVSPKRFLQYLTLSRARERLRASASVLDAALDVGLSGPGRLHDLFVSVDAVTPGEFKDAGKGLELRYGFRETSFGECLAATTPRGLCSLGFVEPGGRGEALEALRRQWRNAAVTEAPEDIEPVVSQIFTPQVAGGKEPLRLLLRGTNFQLKVWEALLRIPEGTVISYGALAQAIGRPGASRAVGRAVGSNPVACLIPCHRVLRSSGEVGGYRWGTARKKALLVREWAVREE